MAKVSGTFSGKVTVQSAVALADAENHALSLVEVAGLQKSSDPLYNDAKITYWGTADLVAGSGPQQGYWVNDHTDGDRDWGTFEGKLTTSGQQVTMEGTYKHTGGTGKFKGMSGGGNYKGHFPSAVDVVNNWEGEYQLVSARAAG